MGLGHPAELGFPVAVQDHPVELAAPAVRLVPVRFGGGEVHMHGGARGVVGVQDRLDGPTAFFGPGDGIRDPFARDIGQYLVHQQSGIRIAFADQAGVQPLPGDLFELAEQVEPGGLAGVPPVGGQQVAGQVEEQGGLPDLVQVIQGQDHGFPDDARVFDLGRA